MIEYLEWDSTFFNRKIGKINLGFDSILDEALNEFSDFELIYIFSNDKIEFQKSQIFHEEKITYTKQIYSDKNQFDIIEFNDNIHSYRDLISLAYSSGIQSRFYLDNNFRKQDFRNLYKKWIDKTLDKTLDLKILVNLIENKLTGFITIGVENNLTARIGLIAISKEFQGLGFATQLIKRAEHIAIKMGFNVLEVTTQGSNIPAKKLYENNGFHIKNVQHVYHYWCK